MQAAGVCRSDELLEARDNYKGGHSRKTARLSTDQILQPLHKSRRHYTWVKAAACTCANKHAGFLAQPNRKHTYTHAQYSDKHALCSTGNSAVAAAAAAAAGVSTTTLLPCCCSSYIAVWLAARLPAASYIVPTPASSHLRT
eukprot:GHRR01032347.1.p1 GENE.GHRR01032347.1~~GHRR01032347.1.p1  ORF type:complete len:142 (+),score=36.20 GHRR01032347.1:969-1394(+)